MFLFSDSELSQIFFLLSTFYFVCARGVCQIGNGNFELKNKKILLSSEIFFGFLHGILYLVFERNRIRPNLLFVILIKNRVIR